MLVPLGLPFRNDRKRLLRVQSQTLNPTLVTKKNTNSR